MQYRFSSFLVLCFCALFISVNAPAQSMPPIKSNAVELPKIAKLGNPKITKLVEELIQYYQKSLDVLFEVNKDAEEKEVGARAYQELMGDYHPLVAGRCAKINAAQGLTRFIAVAYGKLKTNSEDAAQAALAKEKARELAQGLVALLKKYDLEYSDMAVVGDCPVFEYDLEPFYETPVTVYSPKFLNKNRQIKTYLRLYVLKHKPDGMIDIAAEIGAGAPQGRYTGVAKRGLASPTMQISLMRDGKPLLIDGELMMSGHAFKDMVTGEVAPKMPARVLGGTLTIHDGEKHTINNAVMLLARETNKTIGAALGINIPESATYGSFLNVVVVRLKGLALTKKMLELSKLVDSAYATAQKDNPIRSFHPSSRPVFARSDEMMFLAMDLSGDVNALAAKKMKSAEFLAEAKKLGVSEVDVLPFYSIEKGKLRVKFAGRPWSDLNFKGFDGLAKGLYTLFMAVTQEQQNVFEKFGVKAISDDVALLQKFVQESFQALGPMLLASLEEVEFDESLDKNIAEKMTNVKNLRHELNERLSVILVNRKIGSLSVALKKYAAALEETFELAAAVAKPERKEIVEGARAELKGDVKRAIELVDKISGEIIDKYDTIDLVVNYANYFSIGFEIRGKGVVMPTPTASARVSDFNWKWERVLPAEIDQYLSGVKYEGKSASRTGD